MAYKQKKVIYPRFLGWKKNLRPRLLQSCSDEGSFCFMVISHCVSILYNVYGDSLIWVLIPFVGSPSRELITSQRPTSKTVILEICELVSLYKFREREEENIVTIEILNLLFNC